MGLAKRLYSAFRIGGHFGDPMEDSSRLTSWQKAKEVLRIAYTLPFVLASIVGVVFALTTRTEPLISILIPITVLFLALFVNFSNDYFDHKSGVDKLRFSYYDDDPGLKEEIRRCSGLEIP
jgi:1,4-dihydroxy-2-naphthoate octaprenyltransferase